MITDGILFVVSALFGALQNVLPEATFPATLTTITSTVFGIIGGWSWFFPLDHLLLVIGIIAGFEFAMIGVRFSIFVIHLIRG